MHIKTKIKKLEEELKHIRKLVKNVTIDMDNPEYLFYVPAEWDEELEYFDCNMHKKKPVNRAAVDFELHKLYDMADFDYVEHDNYEEFFADIQEYKILKGLPIQTKKGVYKEDPEYLIYKWNTEIDYSNGPNDLYGRYVPYNKAAKKYRKKYGAYCIRKRIEKYNRVRGRETKWNGDF